DRKNIINTIKKSAGMSRELLENLLQWAMTQTGKIPCSPVKLELTKLVENIMELYAAVASNKNISLKKEFNGELFVHADTNMISAILQNLISNAIKFTPENGSVTISLSEENNRAVIKVSDTGIGMSPGDLPKLFRIDTDHRKIGTSKEKGTGLGLILCREFAGLNRGSIFAESEAGKGSAFTVILPLYKT
ncbi:MAG: HAMP domain-containing sensor histidine kinase, partial [Bacteroidota bacterium]